MQCETGYLLSLGRDTEFASFYRAMKAYEASLQGESNRSVLGFTSWFLTIFQNSRGRKRTDIRE
jgi:hypothetical protein